MPTYAEINGGTLEIAKIPEVNELFKFSHSGIEPLVGEEGLEPSLHCWNQILSLARLPIPPLAQTYTAIAEITLVLYNKRQ